MGDNPFTFERIGLGYRMTVPVGTADHYIEFNVDRLDWERNHLYGNIAVRSNVPTFNTFGSGHLHQGRLSLTGTRTKKELADVLGARSNGLDIDWMALAEHLCHEITAAENDKQPCVTLADLPTRMEPPMILAPIIFADQPVILYGQGGIGKSMLAFTMGVSVASGKEIIEGWRPQRGAVLYIDYETNQWDAKSRIESICAGAGIGVPTNFYYRFGNVSLTDSINELQRDVHDLRIKLIIVDPVGGAMGEENGSGDANATTLSLYRALRVLETATLLVDHVSSATLATNVAQKPYGSIYKTNRARAAYEFRRLSDDPDGETTHVTLVNWKRNIGRRLNPIGLALRFAESGAVTWQAEEPVLERTQGDESTATRSILHRLLLGNRMTIEELMEESGLTFNTVKTVLYRYRRGKSKTELFDRLPSGSWEAIPVMKAIEGGSDTL